MNMEAEKSFRDKISTVDENGKRIWIFAKKPKGKFYNIRTVVSAVLLAILFAGPFLKINGEPFLLLNVLERKFVILGNIFWPQDFYIAVFTFIISVISIALFTVVFGRLFCGWICPQTIFMEMVYRRIEYWLEGDAQQQRNLNKEKWTARKIRIKTTKQIIFYTIAFVISNTFLGYIIGGEELIKTISSSPSENFGGFAAIIIFSFLFYGVFAFMREQVCTTICPYGRLQSVMVDKETYAVAYDHVRGEKRAKLNQKNAESGDCIDCKLCVQVCPTGIDIRNGTQLECINCTACIDACDDIMEKIKLPKGLIKYTSEKAIAEKTKFRLSTRAKAYTSLLVILLIIFGFILANRTDIEVNLLRAYGTTFEQKENGNYVNFIQYHLLNKTNKNQNITFKLKDKKGEINIIGMKKVLVNAGKKADGTILIELPKSELDGLKTPILIDVYKNGKIMRTEKINFSGPFILPKKQ